jgi:UDP-N-acetylmuramate dehydrogenase
MYCVFFPIDGGTSLGWRDRLEGSCEEGAALARHTSYRVGGPAKYLVVPATVGDVRQALSAGEKTFVMGAGSNVLVADAGFDGVVLKVCNALAQLSVLEREVVAGAGRRLPSLVQSCAEMGLSGLEWAVGIPGTVGGAACTNAGAFGSSLWECVEFLEGVSAGGEVFRLTPEEVTYGYRHASLPVGEPFVVTEVGLRLTPSDPERVGELTAANLTRRAATQPTAAFTAGSVFKNPPKGPSAGELIDTAGLKGRRRGEAVVSEKHANFIVNQGGARARDLYDLIAEVREEVRARHGVTLELEIELVGDFEAA